ncbi:Oidioi.mRNA.OKI2018_I69.PAR.g8527.t1.cds [Oikopleura dioica]|uniref:Oidioi.mRNA.OKI2018_I69.PAR.g8527.t1.cds n=1 Tax=Oikopleura dioica TaxID=34765 RepID=A0ABN7RGF6_OIKDI|nr:Oidioi.mRNA.OKI2018_I69.PAR.g8527.t1.cds [Oikopleura dioica]
MKALVPFFTGISAIGWSPDKSIGDPKVQPLDCYHCTYRENSDGTTFGNEACQDVSDPEKSKPFKITIPNRFYNVTEPTPVVYRYDCATYWITGTRYDTTGSGETKKTTFTELKRDFIMIPDYNPLFDYGKTGARQAELTIKIDDTLCGSQQMANCSKAATYPDSLFALDLEEPRDTGKCYKCEGAEYKDKNNKWQHPQAHEEGCASLNTDQPVRPCDATCEVLLMSVMQGKHEDPVLRFIQRGCLPTNMDAHTVAYLEVDKKNKYNMETCYDSLCNTGCTKKGCSAAGTTVISLFLLISSLFLI